MMRRLTWLLVALVASPAWAGTSTMTTKDATPSTQTFTVLTNGSGQFGSIVGVCDGSALAQCAAVKAASTPAGATDPALVVSVSPNNTIAATQSGTWNVGTLTSVTNPVAVTQSGSWTSVGVNPTTIATWGLMVGTTPNTAPTNTMIIGGIYNSSPPTPTSGQTLPLQLRSDGSLGVTIVGQGTLNANGQATMANSAPVVIASNQSSLPVTFQDPCQNAALKKNFAIGSSGNNIQIVGGQSSQKVYMCSISIIAAATAVVNVIEGTGAACTTANEAAVIGSQTAANGMSLAANGGFTLGNGLGTVAVTATAANGLCILQSGTTALAGNVTYVQQ